MLFQVKAKIIYNRKVKGDYYLCVIAAVQIARVAQPGQFLNLRVSSGTTPFLRRPLSIHSVAGDRIKLLYQALGEGTCILSKKKAGEYLDIIGPLGEGFDYHPPSTLYHPLLVAGGMGVAPLLFLAEKLVPDKLLVLLGAKTKSQVLCEKEFRKLGFDVKIATDDGSKGFKGRITDLLRKIVLANQRTSEPANQIYACGPRPMLEKTAALAKKYHLPAQLSLEEHMACGIGACLGCVVDTREGFKRVCKEGPVFKADEIIW
jgi:dihydroorotate dehydrogenase electron transfer subunit